MQTNNLPSNETANDLARGIAAMRQAVATVAKPYIVVLMVSPAEYAKLGNVVSVRPGPSVFLWTAVTVQCSDALLPGQRMAKMSDGRWMPLEAFESESA